MQQLLPDDVVALIYQHMCAIKIQKKFRIFQSRYVYHAKWKELRSKMFILLTVSEFSLLSSRHWIRKEWIQAPESWLYTITHNPREIFDIIYEVQNGIEWTLTR